MSNPKHEKSFVDFDKPYEQNVVGLKGIIYFGVGLVILIVITFGLMWVFEGVLEDNARETKKSDNPLALSERERLPPEPRLQSAPGFGVDGPKGRSVLELTVPQAEYRELKKHWESAWKNGTKDEKTGTVVSLPIEQAKSMILQKALKARSDADALQAGTRSEMAITDFSSGRQATLKRR